MCTFCGELSRFSHLVSSTTKQSALGGDKAENTELDVLRVAACRSAQPNKGVLDKAATSSIIYTAGLYNLSVQKEERRPEKKFTQ